MLVHFPVALVTLYCLLELASLIPVVRKQSRTFPIKAFLLIIGFVSSIPTILSGQEAAEYALSEGNAALIAFHNKSAFAMTFVIGFLALLYWGMIASRSRPTSKITKISTPITNFFARRGLYALLAAFALWLITVTGALGGAIVYWPEVDPAVSFIYHLFLK